MTTGTVPSATQSRLLPAPGRAAALAVLTACVFVVGTAEWVMVGLMPQLSADLHRPLPAVGSLVTWYALVVTVAGPLVTVGMLRLARRRALLVLLGVFVAGNLAAALAGSFGALVAARMLTAISASAFNLGVAGGSLLGGQALTAGLSLHDLPWVGALVAGGAVLLAAEAARRSRTTTVTTE
ncbi:MFS transporter [Dactylosporangium sp. NPDC000555]|uniref:MFS transporter n=1 Tax=Dactylosporangium sp. NPDC000555 TaxID=3154260 RepID=UPI00331B9408